MTNTPTSNEIDQVQVKASRRNPWRIVVAMICAIAITAACGASATTTAESADVTTTTASDDSIASGAVSNEGAAGTNTAAAASSDTAANAAVVAPGGPSAGEVELLSQARSMISVESELSPAYVATRMVGIEIEIPVGAEVAVDRLGPSRGFSAEVTTALGAGTAEQMSEKLGALIWGGEIVLSEDRGGDRWAVVHGVKDGLVRSVDVQRQITFATETAEDGYVENFTARCYARFADDGGVVDADAVRVALEAVCASMQAEFLDT